MSVQLHLGDCLDVMQGMPENSIDSIVTDPPYGLSDHRTTDVEECLTAWLAGEPYESRSTGGFMNRSWDSWVPGPEVWRECYRVLKPGGYMLVFAGTRTDDLMSLAIRLAGFRKHPFIAWCFGSGFPKATSLSKMLDKQAGADREVTHFQRHGTTALGIMNDDAWQAKPLVPYTAPATPEAIAWDGWYYGLQSLKPAIEPVLMFQKLHEGRMTDNVLEWGTGAIWIDGCRVEMANNDKSTARARNLAIQGGNFKAGRFETDGVMAGGHSAGRWPANLILSYPQDEHDAAGNPLPNPGKEEVVGCFPVTGASKARRLNGDEIKAPINAYGDYRKRTEGGVDDSGGSAARYFQHCPWDENDVEATRLVYCSKASRRERNAGLEGMPENGKVFNGKSDHNSGKAPGSVEDKFSTQPQQNQHPCCKPLSLMQYLCRLITPPNGTVLDPFLGSGTTGCAAIIEGFSFTGIEIETDYLDIARARIAWAEEQKCERDQAQAIADAQLKLL